MKLIVQNVLKIMKHIKSYKLFESVYSIEEYYDYITKSLGNYNITPVGIRDLLSNYEVLINDYYESGDNPKIVSDQIIKDLELESGGYMGIKFPKLNHPQIKYL